MFSRRFKLRSNYFTSALLFIFILGLLTSCSHIQITGLKADEMKIRQVAKLDANKVFVPDSLGGRVAFSSDGLFIIDLSNGVKQKLSDESPTAAGFSPNGKMLAATFTLNDKTRLKLFDTNGLLISETLLDARIIRVFVVSDTEILAIGTTFETFSFGTSLKEVIYKSRISEKPVEQVIHNTTLKPHTVRTYGSELLSHAVQPVLSPLSDELIYGKIIDPPLFKPYVKIFIRNLNQNIEKEIASQNLDNSASVFAHMSEDIILGDQAGETKQLEAWSCKEIKTFPFLGRKVAISATDRHIIIDGHLHRDGKEIAVFPAESEFSFLYDGRLLMLSDNILYIVDGIETISETKRLNEKQIEQLVNIKAWRSGGLINQEEYATTKEKILKNL